MSLKLVNRNPDLQRLVDRGYAVGFDGAYLLVRDVPYLRADGTLAWGTIVTKLVFVTEEQVQQDDHQIFFAGGHPHGLDGQPIRNLGGGAAALPMTKASDDVIVERSFSNKPRETGKFADFFEKIESYIGIISGPAMEAHGTNPYTFRVRMDETSTSIFKLHDTLTSRAEIGDLAAKFEDEVLAIIGLGGTGGYLLDMAVRTPVKEVRGFDADDFHVHNAFRAPGRLDPDELGQPKAIVHAARYESFRHGVRLERKYIDLDSAGELAGVTFAFVCVDKGLARAEIWDLLIGLGIPFIDVGLGLRRKGEGLGGMVRMTHVAAGDPRGLRHKGYAEMAAGGDDLYRTNIQIGELNALNACLALIRYKQLRGFYTATIAYDHLLMDISDLRTAGETPDDEV
jgi:hypothetical protein